MGVQRLPTRLWESQAVRWGLGGLLWDRGVLVLRKEEKREWLNPKKRDSACRAREIPLEAGHCSRCEGTSSPGNGGSCLPGEGTLLSFTVRC